MSLEKDERFTPRRLVKELHDEFKFTVDAASCAESPAAQVIGRYWDKLGDGLTKSWASERVFCNPPFSEVGAWVQKAHDACYGADSCPEVVVMLIPANRTEQPFWHSFVEPFRDGDPTFLRTRFLKTRTRYGQPDDPEGDRAGSPNFASMLLIWERK